MLGAEMGVARLVVATSLLIIILLYRQIDSPEVRAVTAADTPAIPQSAPSPLPSPYRIILDGGSTGSRLHIYEFTQSSLTNITSCHRRLSTKVEIPLSSFASSPNTSIAQHLLPLFYRAAGVIPAQYHSTTSVHYQATAGMRLLLPHIQEKIYDALFDGFMEEEGFVFGKSLLRENIGTLGGRLEAFNGALAANYLEGIIDVNLQLTHNAQDGEETVEGPLGALDMGGASMQIVYLPDSHDGHEGNSSAKCGGDENIALISNHRLCEEEFFSESYLSYGVDQFRERMWDEWILDSLGQQRRPEQKWDDKEEEMNILSNPCFFEGYTVEYNGYILQGTGDAEECVVQIRRLLYSSISGNTTGAISNRDRSMVGGIEHPPVTGKFFAMALFYFSLDCLRELSNNDALSLSWPTPTLEELGDALDGLCSRKWHGDLEEIKNNSHAFTSAFVLPHRCFESVYLVTLLRDGFRFHPQSRDITFTYLVHDDEVEWSLGMALDLFAQDKNSAVTITGEKKFDEDNIEDEEDETNVTRGSAELEEEDENRGGVLVSKIERYVFV